MALRRLTYLLLLLCFAFTGTAQTIDTHRLDSLLLKPNRGKMPGFAVRILRDNKVIYEGHSGYANISRGLPMSSSSVINIASVTKQFTAYAIFLLEERDQLKTSDEIHLYLPELPGFGSPITLKQLLGHTSGLRDYPDFRSLESQSTNHELQYAEMVEFLQTHHELNFPPGERFCYSNTGYMLLARIIEKVSGMSYSAFLQKEIFDPLEMTHTFVNEGILNEQPDGTTNYTLHKHKTIARKSTAHRDAIGATGIFSNMEDLTKWNRLFYAYESGIAHSNVIAKMETPFTLNDGSSCHYGGGLILKQYRGKAVVEHSGGWGEYLTQWRRFPGEHLTIMVVTNSALDSPFEICDKISNLLVQFNDGKLPEAVETELDLQHLDGTYISEDNIVRHITTDSLQSHLKISNAARTLYEHYSLDHIEALADMRTGLFFADSVNNQLVLTIDSNGTNEFIWNMGTYFQTKRTYVEVEPFTAINPDLAGKYYCAEMDRTVRIRYNRHKKQLIYRSRPFVKKALRPIGNTVYQIEGETYLLRFSENGILFGNDWIYNLRFGKKTDF